jgi:hypothetical protein
MPYRLEASTNLLDWEEVSDAVAMEAVMSVVDPEKSVQAQRFFRVIQEFGETAGDD